MNLHRNSPLPPPWTSRCTDTHNKNSKQNENLHPIWERESEHPQSHCHQIATHISSNLPKINEPKPTSNLRERIRVREREDWNERERGLEWERERIGMRERERIPHRYSSKPPRRCRRSPNHHNVATDLQSMLPISISNPHRSERDTESERGERERKMRNEREEWPCDWKNREKEVIF